MSLNIQLLFSNEIPKEETEIIVLGLNNLRKGDYIKFENKGKIELDLNDYNLENEYSISFENLFKSIEKTRSYRKNNNRDFIFLITTIPNKFNFFCALGNGDEKIGFIHLEKRGNWYESNNNSYLYLGYHIISLIARRYIYSTAEHQNYLDFASNSEFVHHSPKACINSFTENKLEINYLIPNGKICDSCLEKIRSNSDGILLENIISFLKQIRNEMTHFENFSDINQDTILIKITDSKEIILKIEGLGLYPLRANNKVYFIFLIFLAKNNGIFNPNLMTPEDFKLEMMDILQQWALRDIGMFGGGIVFEGEEEEELETEEKEFNKLEKKVNDFIIKAFSDKNSYNQIPGKLNKIIEKSLGSVLDIHKKRIQALIKLKIENESIQFENQMPHIELDEIYTN